MRHLLITILLCATFIAKSQEIQLFDWARTAPLAGTVETIDGRTAVKLTKASKAMIPLLITDVNAIHQPYFGLRGEVRYQALVEDFLEMWVTFDDGSRFFSRTQADEGPVAWLNGDSDWRPLLLPFSADGSTATPVRIELYAAPPAPGTLWVSNLELVQAADMASLSHHSSASATGHPAAWWSDQQAGLAGGIAGAAVGILGGLFGLLAAQGRARGAAMAFTIVLAVAGIACLALGLYALNAGQPYGVWYPLVLVGGIGLVIGLWGRFVFRGAYTRHELRQMRARDAQ